jgi:hypothetical protein
MGETVLVEAHTLPKLPAPNAGATQLKPHEICDILRWQAQGLDQQEIADKFNPPKHQSTICRALQKYGTDTRVEARRILAAGAAAAAIKILRDGKPRDLIQVEQGLDVLSDEGVKGGVTVIVGGQDASVQVNIIGTVSPSRTE